MVIVEAADDKTGSLFLTHTAYNEIREMPIKRFSKRLQLNK